MTLLHLPQFPNTSSEPFVITSQPTIDYNCISWAYGITHLRLWPKAPYYFWPQGVLDDDTIDAFQELFKTQGYAQCRGGDLEEGFQKIAIYANAKGEPQHAARQLPTGEWSSKLGPQYDVTHTINSMANGAYGNVVVYMKKRI